MTGKIIQIEEFRLTRQERSYTSKNCQHLRMTMDSDGAGIVTCDDCNMQISPFWALQILTDHYQKAVDKLTIKEKQQADVEAKTIHLKAAQLAESAWRSRTTVPICPCCSEPVFPSDKFGQRFVQKEIADRMRAKFIEGKQAERARLAAAKE